MQHYSFAVKAFVELVWQFGMDEYEFAVYETKTQEVISDVEILKVNLEFCIKMRLTGRHWKSCSGRIIWNFIRCFPVKRMYICGKAIRWRSGPGYP